MSIKVVLLAVLALRSLLPAGFMVQAAQASDLPFEIVICTSSGSKLMRITDDGTAPTHKSQAVGDGLCPFATAVAAVFADVPRSLADEAQYAAVTYVLASAQFAETPKPGAASARGPPSLVI